MQPHCGSAASVCNSCRGRQILEIAGFGDCLCMLVERLTVHSELLHVDSYNTQVQSVGVGGIIQEMLVQW